MPIGKQYADDFFGHSSQKSVVSPPRARLLEHKSYFGNYRVASYLQPGKLLFFYESKTDKGAGQVVAFARVIRSQIASTKDTSKNRDSRNQGVLPDDKLKDFSTKGKLLETVFTNSVILPKPLSLEKIKIIVKKFFPITAFSIDHQQVCKILKEGGIL